jgi:hypothetical protein
LLCGLLWPLDERRSRRRCGGLGELLSALVIERGTDANIDREALPGMALVNAANRRDVPVIAAICNSNVAKPHGSAERGVKCHPISSRNQNFGPSVGSLAPDHFLLLALRSCGTGGNQVARDVPSRQPAHPRRTEEQMREILANASADRQLILDR